MKNYPKAVTNLKFKNYTGNNVQFAKIIRFILYDLLRLFKSVIFSF